MTLSLSQARVNDPVITEVVHGYCNAESIAPIVAPIVNVPLRAGKVIQFTKEQFAVVNTRRAPGTTIKRLSVNFTNTPFFIEQHAIAGEVTEEQYEEALSGEAQLDLRMQAAARAAEAVAQSWELEVINTITNAGLYEATNTGAIAGIDQWSNPASDPERLVQSWQEIIRSQVGCYANTLILDPDTFNALKFHPIFRDRLKYTDTGVVDASRLANWFGLPGGVHVAGRVQLGADGSLTNMMPAGTAVLLHAPQFATKADLNEATFLPMVGADKAIPSAFYTYQLNGYPIAGVERFDEDRRVYVTDVVAEQSVQATGLGANGSIGAAFLATDTIA